MYGGLELHIRGGGVDGGFFGGFWGFCGVFDNIYVYIG